MNGLACCTSIISACLLSFPAPDSPRVEWNGSFERQLSAYALFEDAAAQIPGVGLIPYDVINPLFSDYSDKHRFVYVPLGSAIRYHDADAFTFPIGSALVKTFSYPFDFRDTLRGRRLIETRLMIHTPDGWKGAAYVWNEEQTEAVLKVAGAEIPVNWIDGDGNRRSAKYLVPDMNQCNTCHRGEDVMKPIGVRARHLNRTFAYPDGDARNQILEWTALGILEGAPNPAAAPKHAQWDDPASGSVSARVRGYLDINCAHCHNSKGHASHTRLDFTWTQTDPYRRGVYYRPTAAGNASRGRLYAVVPGDPEASFLLHRLRSSAPDVRMPELGRTMAHEEGAALIAQWIRTLPESGFEERQVDADQPFIDSR